MGKDGVRNVAILGGGMGALAAAYELSKPELKGRYQVTVYQMGWRLGGKCASARNAAEGMRSEEHGLHIWFGFYRNAFGMMRETYEALDRPAEHPFRSVDGVFMPRKLASFGSLADDGGPWTRPFPDRTGHPWDDGIDPLDQPPADIVLALIDTIEKAMDQWVFHRSRVSGAPVDLETLKAELYGPRLHDRVRGAVAALAGAVDQGALAKVHDDVTRLRDGAKSTLLAAASLSEDLRKLWVVLDIAIALLHGLLDPKDGVLLGGDLRVLDDREFRDWLRAHGAWDVNLWSAPVRALYDTAFAYRDGDPRKPSYAAGVATRVILRILFDYRGSVCYLPRAGFGEVVVQPLYELLRERHVKFEFFHRVDLIEHGERSPVVTRVKLTRQAKLKDPGEPYDPLISVEVPRPGGPPEKFKAWPATPKWELLVDGDVMEKENVDFESRWYDAKKYPGEPVVLERGDGPAQFDDIVLGIPLHAAREVLAPFANDPVLGAAMAKTTAVPTVSAQIWLDVPTSSLGWPDPPGLVGAPPPLDIWTDMTQVMDHEPWPGAASKPQSLHYLCAVAPLGDPWADPSDDQVPEKADKKAKDALTDFLTSASWAIWPGPDAAKKSREDQRSKAFDWSTLHSDRGTDKESRLNAQFWRANIDPTECCPSSFPGNVLARPTAGGSGIENLFLASDSVRNGLDTSCVESAVMSGRQAARALAGLSYEVHGERFFAHLPADRPRGLTPFIGWKGLGQMSIPSPVVFTGCIASAHLLFADRAALQKLVDEKLNGPSGGALKIGVPVGVVLLVFLYGAKGSVPSEAIGCAQDREMCFVVPVVYEHGGLPQFALWMPYITVDTAIAMASGRETWGFAKEHGEVRPPEEPKLAKLGAYSSAFYFTKLDNDTLGIFDRIVTVIDDRVDGARAAGEIDRSQWRDRLFGFLETAAARELKDLFKLFEPHNAPARLPVLNLKQFRDAVDDSRACYQAIDLTYFQLSKIGDFAAAEKAAHCDITKAESHDFVGILGLEGAQLDPTGKKLTIPVPVTLGVSFDFLITSGTMLWKAG